VEKREEYSGVANDTSYRHVVMVFVPSEQLRQLAQQGRTSATEYKRLYKLEEGDPSSWQPMDDMRTFNHYQTTYGFGMKLSQRLRIAEGTDDYKLRNHRFRHFDDERKNWNKKVEDENTEKDCFGYSKYTHVNDGNSFEWRPVIVDRPEAGGDLSKRYYKCKYLYVNPPKLVDKLGAKGGAEDGMKEELDENHVLLAPANPKILGSGALEHQEFLMKVQEMHDSGMSDKDIAKQLNDKLMLKWQRAKEEEEKVGRAASSAAGGQPATMPKPPPITITDVQHQLRKGQLTHSASGNLLEGAEHH